MNDDNSKTRLLDLFIRLRRSGFELGIDEFLAAYKAVEGGWCIDDHDALRELLQLLWCHAPQDVLELNQHYAQWLATKPPTDSPPTPPQQAAPPPSTDRIQAQSEPLPSPSKPEPQSMQLAALPIRAPAQSNVQDANLKLRAYWPLSRREMVYTWRYLRHPVADGPRDQLNITATVTQAAQQGYFLQAVYDRREHNHAHLLLMIDQGGSMTPFHHFTRDLVDTACHDSSIERVDVVYFQNVPPDSVYRDPHKMHPQPLADILSECSADSSVLIVSDAGAARGHRRVERIRRTAAYLAQLKRVSSLIAWLNPMPQERWNGTSAQFIATLVPMFQMNHDGFSHAVDALRGQFLHALG